MELLAPAGSVAALKAAVHNGADAVYLGLDAFNARAKAENFTLQNIREHIEFCHLFGVKVHIAFNTCIKQTELEKFEQYVQEAARAGADAFIVTDLGALDIFRRSGVPLHASTQMGVHNLEGANMAKALGFSRVVLARECTLEDIAEVKKSGLEVEVFAHGALCVSFSGGCLMSSFMSGDSGNRGRCNQPCRLKYECGGKKGYLLSAADLCLLERVDKLRAAGTDSIKLEGRLKTEYYCAEAVSAYRAALDGRLTGAERGRLLRAYNRGGFTSGYGVDDTNKLISAKIQNNSGEESGVIRAVGKGFIDVKADKDIAVGDGVKIVRGGEEIGGATVEKMQKLGDILRISCKSEKLRPGDKVCVTFDKSRAEELKNIRRTLSVDLALTAEPGGRARLTAECGGERVAVEDGAICSAATGAGTEEAARRVLAKSAGEFAPQKIEINIAGAFIPASRLNDMRKRAIEKIRAALLNNYNKTCLHRIASHAPVPWAGEQARPLPAFKGFVLVGSAGAAVEVKGRGYAAILQISDYKSEKLNIIMKNKVFDNNIGNFLSISVILRKADMAQMRAFLQKHSQKFQGLYCENLGALALAREFGKHIVGGIGLNIYNNKCMDILPPGKYCASCELTLKELEPLAGALVYAYGRVRLMTLTHCPVKLNFGGSCSACRHQEGLQYKDGFGVYPLRRVRVANCYFSLYNPVCTDISGKAGLKEKFGGNILLDMVEYDTRELSHALTRFESGAAQSGVTCGHLFRGVK